MSEQPKSHQTGVRPFPLECTLRPNDLYVGIDPGPDQSGVALLWLDGVPVFTGVLYPNWRLTHESNGHPWLVEAHCHVAPGISTQVYCERFQSYGTRVADPTWFAVLESGRIIHELVQGRALTRLPADQRQRAGQHSKAVYMLAKTEWTSTLGMGKGDSVPAAIQDILGLTGSKKAPGPTHGFKTHIWDALGLLLAGLHRDGRVDLWASRKA